MGGKGIGRFWTPVVVLAVFAIYVSQKLILSHIDPRVASLEYEVEMDQPARRGSIFDVKGTPLVRSVSVWDYHFDPVSMTNAPVRMKGMPARPPEAIVKTIATSLGLDYNRVLAMSRDSARRYQPLTVSSDRKAHEILSNAKLVRGVVIEDKHVRQYLLRRRLSHVLGSVNAEEVGSAGIELRYQRLLAGLAGKVVGVKDAHGRELYDRRKVSIDPVPGADVYLTIDHNIQYDADTVLQGGLSEFGAGSGWCLVMDAKTGAILAMSSLPDFDPLFFGRASESAKLNRTIAFTYEPGSVMKVITAAVGLETKCVTLDTLYATNRDDDRYYRLPGDGSHKWEPRMSVGDAIVHSSNIVIGKLGVDIGPERLWKGMRAFGFGAKTGVELPGEETGILPNWKQWDKVKWSRAPIGQGVAVTALQLASAYQAIANDGVRMRPHIVSRVVASDGIDLYRHVDEALAQPVSRENARALRKAMEGVASPAGTARRAAIRGYSVAGKTGTAQKPDPSGRGYAANLFRATFCGMVPAGDPELVILVTLDFDTCPKFHQGGNSSGVLFRRIATAALRYLMIQPDKPEELADAGDGGGLGGIMDARVRKYDIISGE